MLLSTLGRNARSIRVFVGAFQADNGVERLGPSGTDRSLSSGTEAAQRQGHMSRTVPQEQASKLLFKLNGHPGRDGQQDDGAPPGRMTTHLIHYHLGLATHVAAISAHGLCFFPAIPPSGIAVFGEAPSGASVVSRQAGFLISVGELGLTFHGPIGSFRSIRCDSMSPLSWERRFTSDSSTMPSIAGAEVDWIGRRRAGMSTSWSSACMARGRPPGESLGLHAWRSSAMRCRR